MYVVKWFFVRGVSLGWLFEGVGFVGRVEDWVGCFC